MKELYDIRKEKCKATDIGKNTLAIVPDKGLKDCLNRLFKPAVGDFALTPEDIVERDAPLIFEGRSLLDDYSVCKEILNNHPEMDLRYVHGEVQRIRDICREVSNPSEYVLGTGKDLFTDEFRSLFSEYMGMPTFENAVGKCPVKGGILDRMGSKGIKVYGKELFSSAQEQILRGHEYSEVKLFRKQEYDSKDKYCGYEIPVIYQADGNRDAAEHIADLIKKHGKPTDFAVVVSAGSSKQRVLKSVLFDNGIPVDCRNDIASGDLRDYLSVLQIALDFPRMHVRDIRPLFSSRGIQVDRSLDNQLLSAFMKDLDQGSRCYGILKKMSVGTTYQVLAEMFFKSRDTRPLKEVMDALDLSGVSGRISRAGVSELTGAFSLISSGSSQILDDEKSGVLLVTPDSMFIDRPIVVYLGMDSEWSEDRSGLFYVDKKKASEKEEMRLSVLMQQGLPDSEGGRVYIVSKTEGGSKPIPCNALRSLAAGKKFEGFESICGRLSGMWPIEVVERTHPGLAFEGGEVNLGSFSKSSYSVYLNCPYRWNYYHMKSESTAQSYMGTLIHSFAEMYYYFPETGKGELYETAKNHIYDLFAGMSAPELEKRDRGDIGFMTSMVIKLVDSRRKHLFPEAGDVKNDLMGLMGLKVEEHGCSEIDLKWEEKKIHGSLDLLDGTEIWDYKTGRVHDAVTHLSDMKTYQDYQPLFYLSLLHNRLKGCEGYRLEDLTFNLFYVKKCRDVGEDMAERTLTFRFGDTFEVLKNIDPEHIRKLLNKDISEAYSSNWGRILDVLGREDILGFTRGIEYDKNWRAEADDKLKLADIKVSHLDWFVSALKKMSFDGMVAIFEGIDEVNSKPFGGHEIVVPSEGLETFLEKISEDHSELRRSIESGELSADRKKCDKCPYRDVCIAMEEDDFDE